MSKAFIVAGALALLSALCVVARAAEGQTQQVTPAREEVVARAWKAMFGERQDEDIRSVYVEGYFHGATDEGAGVLPQQGV